MRPHLEESVYVNNLGDEGQGRVQAAYGDNYPRLAALKEAYDPDNLFRANQNIDPSTDTASGLMLASGLQAAPASLPPY